MRFQDKVVVVTGASSGIGLEAARAFAAEGAHVVGTGRDQARLAGLGSFVELPLTLDLRDATSVRIAAAAVLGRYGRVDVLVNNAGGGLFKAWDEATLEQQMALMDLNLWGAVRITRELLPSMVAAGAGVVCNVASVAGRRGYPRHSAYCATKHALIGWSEGLRCDLEASGVDVVVVCPPAVQTPFFENAGYHTFKEDHPGLKVMSAAEAGRGIVEAVARRERLSILGPRAKALDWAARIAPGGLDELRRRAGKLKPRVKPG